MLFEILSAEIICLILDFIHEPDDLKRATLVCQSFRNSLKYKKDRTIAKKLWGKFTDTLLTLKKTFTLETHAGISVYYDNNISLPVALRKKAINSKSYLFDSFQMKVKTCGKEGDKDLQYYVEVGKCIYKYLKYPFPNLYDITGINEIFRDVLKSKNIVLFLELNDTSNI